MLKFLLVFLCSCTLLHAEFYNIFDKNNNKRAVLFSYLSEKKSKQLFDEPLFKLPNVLKELHNANIPIIIALPAEVQGRSPLDERACFFEGARVALAWASSFFRFKELGNIDVRVLLFESSLVDRVSLEQICSLGLNNASFEGSLAVSLEDQMEQRCKVIGKIGLLKKCDDCRIEPLQDNPVSVDISRAKKLCIVPRTLEKQQVGQKRYLITGGAGFIGRHLTERLLKEGQQVIVVDNGLCCDEANFDALEKYKNCYVQRWDATIPFTVEGNIDYVLHLASVPSPEFYYALPVETLRTGLHGTKNCMDLALEKRIPFLFASTSEVYGEPKMHPQPETYEGNVNPIGKRSQYDQSKRGAETLIKLYVDRSGLDVRIARLFNTYGPYMKLEDGRVVTNFVQALIENKSVVIYGDGSQTRSFAYVSDTVDCIVRLMNFSFSKQVKLSDKVFNVGSEYEITVNELARTVNKLARLLGKKVLGASYRENIDKTDPTRRRPDLTRSRNVLGYQPEISVLQGIQHTYEFFDAQLVSCRNS